MTGVAEAAIAYAERGIPVLPLRPRSKLPASAHGKKDASTDPHQIASWFPPGTDRNIGVLTGAHSGLIVVDVDPRNGGEASFDALQLAFGQLPQTLRAKTGGGGFHLYFKVPLGAQGLRDRPNAGGYRGVDVKADGYVVAAPSIHESGSAYMLDNELPWADAPAWLVGLARGEKSPQHAGQAATTAVPEGGRNDALFRMASSLRARDLSPEAILAAVKAENTARCIPPLEDREVDLIVQSAMRYEPGTSYPETELGNSRRMVAMMNGDARYEPAAKTWFVWTGRQWIRDEEGLVVRFAKRVVDDLLASAKLIAEPDAAKRRAAFAFRSQSAARIAGMIELAKTEPGVPIRFDAFDRQLHTLNVKNGLVDLRTGALMPHCREAFASQLIDIEFDAEAKCPTFETSVAAILSHDPELIQYLAEAFGYAATGETREQCFFVFYGDGANGKSTVLNQIRHVLGSYAKHTPTETLIAKSGGGASNDLARLAGSRFVTAQEANADQKIADALLKQITGDEPITARFLFKEFISFRPTFKLFLATNQLPQVNGSDPAMWRRIRTIPFTRVFAPDEQDRDLARKLAAEEEGILTWIIRGAVSWYANGLTTPTAVRQANTEYRAEMDSVGQFLDERCRPNGQGSSSASSLYASYRLHSNDNGRSPVTTTMFGRTLTARGFRPEKRGGTQFRLGVELRPFAIGESK